ncbi:conserved hypothetical protein [Ricinus communis]|uniref:Uncharacterized protein n=1 Tax=Ricinus communis TaxID=3988 RepID=B9SZK6_RICCO|nr:conserved hypothetical protein [Ricinus communis]
MDFVNSLEDDDEVIVMASNFKSVRKKKKVIESSKRMLNLLNLVIKEVEGYCRWFMHDNPKITVYDQKVMKKDIGRLIVQKLGCEGSTSHPAPIDAFYGIEVIVLVSHEVDTHLTPKRDPVILEDPESLIVTDDTQGIILTRPFYDHISY